MCNGNVEFGDENRWLLFTVNDADYSEWLAGWLITVNVTRGANVTFSGKVTLPQGGMLITVNVNFSLRTRSHPANRCFPDC